jgi:phosphoglycolate phosphatase-like HAD superfamily hydrolase
MTPTLLLFDVDGTLISSNNVGRLALQEAFHRVLGPHASLQEVAFAGRTDRAIVRAGLQLHGEDGLDLRDRIFRSYLPLLSAQVALRQAQGGQSPAQEMTVHPGVNDLLLRAEHEPQMVLALGTGNIRDGARIKLEGVDLWRRFVCGGFGDDREDRGELVGIAAERAAAHLQLSPADCRKVVLGDTPHDIQAAKAIEAESVAIATGPFGAEELNRHEPTLTVETLADRRVTELLFEP